MRKLQLLTAVFFWGGIFFLTPTHLQASEGMVELRSTVGQPSRCLVTSTFMPDLNYTLLASCRDLIYPPDVERFSYLVWATPIGEQKATKLGELGVGKAEFRTATPFSSLFVTRERSVEVEQPSEAAVMQGLVKPIGFLEALPEPKPISELEKVLPTPTPKSVATEGGEIAAIVRRIFLIFFVAIFGLAIVAFAVISTLRRLRE